jgi:hypothetical protein
MKLRKTFSLAMICMMMVLVINPGVQAQEPQTGKESRTSAQEGRETKLKQQLNEMNLGDKVFVMNTAVGQAIEVISGDVEYRFGGKPIKGAPFSAQVVIENTQTLANGVRISHNSSGMLHRDSEGRTRREQPSEGTPEIVFIDDPVASAFYRLHMIDHTVSKVMFKQVVEGMVNKKITEKIARSKASSTDAPKTVTVTVASGEQTITEQKKEALKAEIIAKQRAEEQASGRERKTESLGTQMFDGVEAEGTRTTLTIPTGKEGNDRPFEIVSERWYSPALQLVVMSKHSDPRMGDNVYRLANITLGEPLRSLFTVPSDFTTNEEKIEGRKKE